MKIITAVMCAVMIVIALTFSVAKSQHDAAIAEDTKRIADSLDENTPKHIILDCGLNRSEYTQRNYGKASWVMSCEEVLPSK